MAPDHASIDWQTADGQTADWQTATQQNVQYYLRVLHELIEMGTDFARQLHRQACPPAEAAQPQTTTLAPAATQDLSIAFDRIARAIRRTICLAQKLCEPVKARPAPRFGENGARKRNLRAVDDSFQPDPEEVDPAKLTDKELAERIDRLKLELDLDDLDEDEDDTDRPIAEIIDDICCDLGIAHLPDTPAKRRLIADLALLITSPQAKALRRPTDVPTAAAQAADRVGATHPHRRNAASKSTDPPPP